MPIFQISGLGITRQCPFFKHRASGFAGRALGDSGHLPVRNNRAFSSHKPNLDSRSISDGSSRLGFGKWVSGFDFKKLGNIGQVPDFEKYEVFLQTKKDCILLLF